MPAARRREAISCAVASSSGNATPTSRTIESARRWSARERDHMLLLFWIVARDDRDHRLVVRILRVVRHPGRNEEKVARDRLHLVLERVAPVMNGAAADDVDRALEIAVRVRLGLRVRRHHDEVERKRCGARRRARDAQVVRDLLLRLERFAGPDADAAVVAGGVDAGRRLYCTPPFVMRSASRTFSSFSFSMTFSSSATS